ncbi:MAG: phosphatidate cytidylyltransferase [Frankiaceae bacterium]|jgi:phosphatidate cytidylyltransferase|nr:phosphatidate cytidylyltransferase [Frankiaceae bacterium]
MSVATPPSPAGVPDVDEPAVPSRAGRNLPAAIAVGLALAALILGTLFTRRSVFVGVIAAAVAVGVIELCRALGATEARPSRTPLVLGGVVTTVVAYQRGTLALLFGLVVTCLACLAWRLADGVPGFVRDWTASVFVAAYVPFLAGFAALMTAPVNGGARIASFIATTVCSDVGGYAAGALAGRHPMAPAVSPKKTWEGLGGSALACVVCGVALVSSVMEIAWWQGAVFGLAVACAATIGDLGESMVKRDVGIKDMGHLLPGHGGLMDRLDSLLIVAPVAWLLLTAWAPVR